MKLRFIFPALLATAACSASGGDPSTGPPAGAGAAPAGTATSPGPAPSGTNVPVLMAPAVKKRCEPGVYMGAFNGQVFVAGLPLDASGSVKLTLASKAGVTTGEFTELSIESGAVTGTVAAGTYAADVVGKLNCTTLKIENGGLQNGVYTGFPPLTFEGPITADYVLDTHAFVFGTWNIVDLGTPVPHVQLGKGAWGANLQP